MFDPQTFLSNGEIPRTNRERGILLDQLRDFHLQQTNIMTKIALPQTPAIDRLVAAKKAKAASPDDFEMLGMSMARVEEIEADIKANPNKYPGPNKLAKAVLAAGVAEIRQREGPPAATAPNRPAARPAPVPVKRSHAQVMASLKPAEKTAYFRANQAAIRAETFAK